jgi:Icc-related predicted phosphoesterase
VSTTTETRASTTIRVAAAGDVHCRPAHRDEVLEAFADLDERADLLLLAGDLTSYGDPEEAQILADACRDLELPVYTVLGNHDWHVNRAGEVIAVLEDAGIRVLERDHHICTIAGHEVGVVGAKGFIGGFPGSHLPDFGEPLLREVYAEAGRDVEAVHDGLVAIAQCALRLVVLHYAPTTETLVGEPEGIWAFLGTDRLAVPILELEPDLVVHGHAHAGTFEGRIGTVPVYNVSQPVMQRDFNVFQLPVARQAPSSIH